MTDATTQTQTIQTQWVQLPSQDVAIAAYLVTPAAEGRFPAVVVLQEIFGVNSHIRDVAERFGRLGYVAIAPALYQRQAPGFETGYTADDIKIGRDYKANTKATELLSDIQAAIDHMKSLPNVIPDAIGCIGFCFGGHVAYLAATLDDIRATASFYGAGITTWCPGEDEPTLNRTGDISGTLYAFFGMEDTSIPPEQVDAIAAALEAHEVPHQVFRYPGADHGFFCDQRGSYSADAARDAWEKVQQLFGTTLVSR
ncbi:MAG: dienelactone hydrolase family protein [Elainellaceae cyanobacterium]